MRNSNILGWIMIAGMVMVISLLVLNIEMEPQITSGMLLMMDDFSQVHGGWETSMDTGVWAGIQQGALRMTIADPHTAAHALVKASYEDVRIEVDASLTDGAIPERVGVICRAQDAANYYALAVRRDGSAAILKVQQGEAVVLRTSKDVRSPVKEISHLRADCVGARLILSVDGRKLLETRDRGFKSGSVGVMAGSGEAGAVELLFDNFMVYNP